MTEVFKSFDRVIIINRRFPNVTFKDYDFEKFLKLSTDSFFVQFKYRDADGRKIFLEKVAKKDPEEFDEIESIKTRLYAGALAMFEEETQIAGTCHIIDFSGSSLKQSYSISMMLELVEVMQTCAHIRLPSVYVINLPSFVRAVFDAILLLAKTKLKQRIILLKKSEDLKNFIDPDLLPKEYGGNKNFDEVAEDFSELYEKYGKYTKSFYDIEIDWSKVSEDEIWNNGEIGNIGSFRKLEID